jgi:hypothetical protein
VLLTRSCLLLRYGLLLLAGMAPPLHGAKQAAGCSANRCPLACIAGNGAPDGAERRPASRAS